MSKVHVYVNFGASPMQLFGNIMGVVRWAVCLSLFIVFQSCLQKPKQKTEVARTLPKPDLLTAYLDSAKKENKKLFMLFGFEQCGACKIFHNYHKDQKVKEILDRYFLIMYVDINHTPGATELFKKYGAEAFPSWAIVDTSVNMLFGSRTRVPGTTNAWQTIGYPSKESSILYYLDALKKSSGRMSDQECRVLNEKLKSYRQKILPR